MSQRFRKSRYRKQARTIPIRASDGDSGREEIDKGNLFRCWNCGFICDIRRDELAKDGRLGATISEATATSHGDTTLYYAVGDAVQLDAGLTHDPVLMKETADGTAETVYRHYSVSGTGCPLCHTRNWKKQ